jgi:hypothetical protein
VSVPTWLVSSNLGKAATNLEARHCPLIASPWLDNNESHVPPDSFRRPFEVKWNSLERRKRSTETETTQYMVIGMFGRYADAEAAVLDLESAGIVGEQVETISDIDEDARPSHKWNSSGHGF